MTGITTGSGDAPDPRRWAALCVLLTGAFLAPLDFFIVNVAMPSIKAGLGATTSDEQLVISGYAVVFAVCLVTGGRLGDRFGRKAVFLAGLAGFAAASALCGLAWSPLTLILARLVQALAAAAMAPQALASVHALFPVNERGRALGIYGVTIGLSSAVGQLVGGALVAADLDGLGWRLVFLINLPIALVAFVAAVPLLRETRADRRPRLDIFGIVLSSVALTVFVLPLIQGRQLGWPWWAIAMLLSTPLFVGLFRRHELALARAGGEPLIPIEVFQAPGLIRGLAAVGAIYAMATFFLVYSIYLQTALGFNALWAGLAILPFTVGFMAGSTASPGIGRRMGAAAPSLGFALCAAGLVAVAAVTARWPAGVVPPLPLVVPALVLLGFGMGLVIPTMVRVIVERVEPGRAGLVGGIVNSTLQVGAAVGIAVLGGLFFTALGGRNDPASVTRAFWMTLLAIAGCHLVGMVLARGLGQRRVVCREAG